MKSVEYKRLIANIVKNALKRSYPGLKLTGLEKVGLMVAINIHARMYGTNVDGVDSPIWRDLEIGKNQYTDGIKNLNQPNIDAKDLLK